MPPIMRACGWACDKIKTMKSYKTDMNNRVIFSKDMKIIELIDADYGLLSILLRLDI